MMRIIVWSLLLSYLQRLAIAKEFGDKAAERRAYSNLGNAFIFLSQFNTATEYYRWGQSWECHLVVREWSKLNCIVTKPSKKNNYTCIFFWFIYCLSFCFSICARSVKIPLGAMHKFSFCLVTFTVFSFQALPPLSRHCCVIRLNISLHLLDVYASLRRNNLSERKEGVQWMGVATILLLGTFWIYFNVYFLKIFFKLQIVTSKIF